MKPTPYDTYWHDSKNWKWHLIYVCKEDPRIIVPKIPTWKGRTLNFAHRKSFVVLFFTILAAAIPLALLGHLSAVIFWVLYSAIIAGIIAFYYCVELYAD